MCWAGENADVRVECFTHLAVDVEESLCVVLFCFALSLTGGGNLVLPFWLVVVVGGVVRRGVDRPRPTWLIQSPLHVFFDV